MNDLDRFFEKKRIEMEMINVPEELELKLRSALNNTPPHLKYSKKFKIKWAAIIVAAIILGSNIDTLAFYGKKLVGYEGIMNGTLSQLNELGKGQIIGKSYTFEDGTAVTLDGVMLDENQLLIFYTIRGGNVLEFLNVDNSNISGIAGEYMTESAQGEIDKENNEVKWIASFSTPHFFEKRLKWEFEIEKSGENEKGEISFVLDRNKAMGYTLKKHLNEKVKVDNATIRFQSITASPTTTVVKGKIQNIIELAADQITGERIRPYNLDIKIYANGKEVSIQGSEMNTDIKGMKFSFEYDALPKNLKELQIKLVSFEADYDASESVKLERNEKSQSVEINGQKVEINKVYEKDGETYINITTEENVALSKVNLTADDKDLKLQGTISGKHEKKILNDKESMITYTRTLRFNGTGEELTLNINSIKYNKMYNKIIDIPMN